MTSVNSCDKMLWKFDIKVCQRVGVGASWWITLETLLYSSQNMNCTESSVHVNPNKKPTITNALSGPQPQESPRALTTSPVPERLSSTSTNINENLLIWERHRHKSTLQKHFAKITATRIASFFKKFVFDLFPIGLCTF